MMIRLIAPLVAGCIASSASAQNIIVIVHGTGFNQGYVLGAVYDQSGFLRRPSPGGMFKLNSPGNTIRWVFHNVKPGRYALTVFHDINGNGKLDRNANGVPTESYGFSNNAQGVGGPPTFEQAAFVVGPNDKTVRINLD
jgi:uncharacterized protein (DUF2141 family)